MRSFTIFTDIRIYSGADYAGLLSTYSPTIALPTAQRQNFLTDIEMLIDKQFGGKLQKRFAFTLAIAQKQ